MVKVTEAWQQGWRHSSTTVSYREVGLPVLTQHCNYSATITPLTSRGEKRILQSKNKVLTKTPHHNFKMILQECTALQKKINVIFIPCHHGKTTTTVYCELRQVSPPQRCPDVLVVGTYPSLSVHRTDIDVATNDFNTPPTRDFLGLIRESGEHSPAPPAQQQWLTKLIRRLRKTMTVHGRETANCLPQSPRTHRPTKEGRQTHKL